MLADAQLHRNIPCNTEHMSKWDEENTISTHTPACTHAHGTQARLCEA